MSKVDSRKFTVVTFYRPGSFFSEESTQEVTTHDPKEIAKLAPEHSFCFTIRDYVAKTTIVDGEEFEKTEAEGESTGRFYIGGSVYTVDEMRAQFGEDSDKRILISNMESNGWPAVIQCKTGNWQPFGEKDELLEAA